MKQTLCGMVVLLITGAAPAQATVEVQAPQHVQQGHVVPAAVAEQLKQVPIIRIGSQKVRPLPPAARIGKRSSNTANSTHDNSAAESETATGHTLVARASDNLVGVSTNELVIIGSNLDAIAAKVATLHLTGIQIQAYPKLKLLVVKTAQFDQLETVHNSVAAAFPDAKFDLPVTYFPRRPH